MEKSVSMGDIIDLEVPGSNPATDVPGSSAAASQSEPSSPVSSRSGSVQSSTTQLCQNSPCPEQSHAAFVCYHKECGKLMSKPYRLLCEACDASVHEESQSHIRSSFAQFQIALQHYTPSEEQLSPGFKRDRLGSSRWKKKKHSNPEPVTDQNDSSSLLIHMPNNHQHRLRMDSSLLRTRVEEIASQHKMDLEQIEVVHQGTSDHVNIDNHVLAFCGQALAIVDQESNINKQARKSRHSSKLSLGHFVWRRDSKGAAKTISMSSDVDRWGSNENVSVTVGITGAQSLTALDTLGSDLENPDRHVSARTNKKLAKLLGADGSGLEAPARSESEHHVHSSAKASQKLGNPKGLAHVRSMSDQLEMFSLYGISRDATTAASRDTRSDFWLPSTWTGLTDNVKALSKRNIDEQEAIWELLTTQITHVERLWTLSDVFQESLVILQERGFLKQVKIDRLFLNIADLKNIDENFWRYVLSNVFKEAKQNGTLLKAAAVADAFDGFTERFSAYVEYCGNQLRTSKYLAVLKKEDTDFMVYLKWCESHPSCKRLALTDIMAAPFQRLTKYPLLIKAIMKKTSDDSAKESLQGVLQTMEKFLGNVNSYVSVCQRRAQLQAVADRLDENFVEVPPEFEQYVVAGLNLQDRMWTMDGTELGERELVLEESFKLKEFGGKFNTELKMDVIVFLFSDMLLITKSKTGGRLQIVQPPLMIHSISVTRTKDANTLYLVHIHTVGMAQAFMILTAHSPQAASAFAKSISETQYAYRSLSLKKAAQNSAAATDSSSRSLTTKKRKFSRKFPRIQSTIYRNKNRRPSEDSKQSAPMSESFEADGYLSGNEVSMDGGSENELTPDKHLDYSSSDVAVTVSEDDCPSDNGVTVGDKTIDEVPERTGSCQLTVSFIQDEDDISDDPLNEYEDVTPC